MHAANCRGTFDQVDWTSVQWDMGPAPWGRPGRNPENQVVLAKLERAMGIEPTTYSLGS